MSVASIHFGRLPEAGSAQPWRPTGAQATSIGSTSILLWAVWPSLAATLLLVLFGLDEITTLLVAGAILIVAGAAVGTWPRRGGS